MILDTSAIIAIALQEPGWERLFRTISDTEHVCIGAPTLVETTIVLSARLRTDARGLVARMLQELNIETIAFGEDHFGMAMDAWLRFGKGRHPAQLNFGDCMSYATAKLADATLLCIGNDFPQTDLALA